MSELKPCPFCGSEYPAIFENELNYKSLVACSDWSCGVHTPICDSTQEAIEIWNRRADVKGDADED